MNYSFMYLDKNTIYLEVGYRSQEEAKKALERIANVFCNENIKTAKGIIKEKESSEILKSYNINYIKNKIKLTKFSTKTLKNH